jgi:hypothetical protein
MDQPGIFAVQIENLDKRGNPASVNELARIAKTETPQVLPRIIGYVAVRDQQAVEHVIMKDDEHAVLGRADVNFIPVAAEFKGSSESLQRVFMGMFRCATVADDVDTFTPFRDALVPSQSVI